MDTEEEVNRPCSHGTEPVLNRFVEDYGSLPHGGVLINIQTLLRNIISDKVDDGAVLDKLKQEIRYITTILAPHLARNSKGVKPFIMFYLFNYLPMLSGHQLRPDSALRKKITEQVINIFKDVDKQFGSGNLGERDGVQIFAFHDDLPGNLPHSKLFEWVSRNSHNRNLCMVSHQAIDWHLYMFVNNLALVNSYTGETVTPKQFSEKCFGDKFADMPFYVGVHRLLGDKHLLSPLLTPKGKRELLELAEKEDWKLHSASYIKKQIEEKYKV